MHIHFLDPYQEGNSPLHKIDPRVLFVITIGFIFTVSLVPAGDWPIYILLYSLVLSGEILSGIRVGYFLRRSLLALPFIIAAVPILFTLEGPALISVAIGEWNLSFSQAGLERFLSILLKSWVSIQAAILLATCMPFPDLLQAMRALRIPRLIVAVFALMWRYLFVFADEAVRLLRARAARSGELETKNRKTGGSILWRGRVAGGMVGGLLLRAYERSDNIYAAMVSRGYDGEVRSFPLPKLHSGDWLLLILFFALFSILLFSAYLFF